MKKQLFTLAILTFFSIPLSLKLISFPISEKFAAPLFSTTLPGSIYFPSYAKDTDPALADALIFSQTLSSISKVYINEEKNEPLVKDVKKEPLISPGETAPLPEDIKETTIIKGGTSLFGIEINNETSYDLSNAFETVSIKKDPTVLIVHTHTSESYRPSESYSYIPTDNCRTEDVAFNVARVGQHLASCLSEYGINVIHDASLNDFPSYNGSYKKTLELIESYLKKDKTIDMVIDLHRDAMERTDGTKISTVCNTDGEKAAQIMLVTGTDQGGLSHPYWKSNFSFAVELQKLFNQKYPHLARPVNVRCERFNGHVLKKELIIEVGTTGNTLDEALVSARAIADVINSFYNG